MADFVTGDKVRNVGGEVMSVGGDVLNVGGDVLNVGGDIASGGSGVRRGRWVHSQRRWQGRCQSVKEARRRAVKGGLSTAANTLNPGSWCCGGF